MLSCYGAHVWRVLCTWDGWHRCSVGLYTWRVVGRGWAFTIHTCVCEHGVAYWCMQLYEWMQIYASGRDTTLCAKMMVSHRLQARVCSVDLPTVTHDKWSKDHCVGASDGPTPEELCSAICQLWGCRLSPHNYQCTTCKPTATAPVHSWIVALKLLLLL